MGYIIHLEYETAQQLINTIHRTAERMYDMTTSIQEAVIMADWQSSAREEFVDELYILTHKLRGLFDQADMLAIDMGREIDQWREVASHL